MPLFTRILQETNKVESKERDNVVLFRNNTADFVVEILWVIAVWAIFILYHGGRGYKKLKMKYDKKMAIVYKIRNEKRKELEIIKEEEKQAELIKSMDEYYYEQFMKPEEEKKAAEERKKKEEA